MTDIARHVVPFQTAARELGLSSATLKKLCDQGNGPRRYRLTARIVGIMRCDLDAFKVALRMPDTGPHTGFVYVIRSGGHVKIGYTRNPPENRLSYLQIGSAERLSLVASFKGSLALERQLHAHFDHLRTGGEWFREAGALAAWIKAGCRIRVDQAEDGCAA